MNKILSGLLILSGIESSPQAYNIQLDPASRVIASHWLYAISHQPHRQSACPYIAIAPLLGR